LKVDEFTIMIGLLRTNQTVVAHTLWWRTSHTHCSETNKKNGGSHIRHFHFFTL